MQHSCHYKKLDLACVSYNLSFEKHESSSSLHVKTLFLWWKCVFQMLEYWAMQPGQYWTILQYMAILGNTALLGNTGQLCPRCLCTAGQVGAYLRLLAHSVWLQPPFTQVSFSPCFPWAGFRRCGVAKCERVNFCLPQSQQE